MDNLAAAALLGIPPGSSEADVRAAFRRLAKSAHPDAGGAEASFRLLKQAADLLVLAARNGTAGAVGAAPHGPGTDIIASVSVPLETVMNGGQAEVPGSGPCLRCDGSGSSGERFLCGQCGGTGRGELTKGILRLRVTCPGCGGSGEEPRAACPGCAGTGTRHGGSIVFTVPAGIAEGATVTVPGRGRPGSGGAPAGDLVVTVTSVPNPAFRRSGADLATSAWVSFAELCLGGRVTVDVPGREGIVARFPPGSGAGAVVRVAGGGLPSPGGPGELAVRLWPRVPRSLTPAQKEAIERWAELDGSGTT